MRPFTSVLPKPLIPIKGKPVMVRILNQFMKYGADKIFAMINYKSEIIKAFFKEIDYKFNISFIEERKPLGTAGSLYFLKGKKYKNYLITNCDTIINFDPKKFITDHVTSKSDITILTSNIDVTIPYGVCLTDDKNNFLGLNEKSKKDYLVNIGVYLINRRVLNLIKKEKYLDFDELIKQAKKIDLRLILLRLTKDPERTLVNGNNIRVQLNFLIKRIIKMKILCTICMRGGSKGLKNKNLSKIKNKYLMWYTINAAKKSNIFKDIVISSDSSSILKVAKSFGINNLIDRRKLFLNQKLQKFW